MLLQRYEVLLKPPNLFGILLAYIEIGSAFLILRYLSYQLASLNATVRHGDSHDNKAFVVVVDRTPIQVVELTRGLSPKYRIKFELQSYENIV